MTLENIIIIAAIALLFIYCMPLLQFLTLLYYSFRYTDFQEIDKEEVEPSILEILKPSEDFLLAKGFGYVAMVEHQSPIVGNTLTYHIAYYYDDANGVHAFVRTQPHRGALEPVTISYKAYYRDGTQLVTVNGMKHFMQVVSENVVLYDHYLIDNEAIYRAHLEAMEKMEADIAQEPISKEEIASLLTQEDKAFIESLQKAGIVKTDNEGYRFRFSLATWKFAKEAAKWQSRYAKTLRARKENAAMISEGETHALKVQIEEMDKPRGKSNRLLWFGISALAFVVLFLLLGFSFEDIGILVAVLLIHELAHFLTMRLFGYTDTHILFLPFGAVAMGQKAHRKAWQEYIVFLAGPLPGIVIGSGIMVWIFWYHQNFARSEVPLFMFALMSLIINYINLLPIYPLDGGRILQLLLLQRYPKGQFYFYMAGLAILTIAMIWLQDPVLLIFVGIVALGVKQSWRVSRFMSGLYAKHDPKSLDKDTVIKEIVHDETLQKEPLSTKANIAKQVVYIIQTSRPSKWFVALALAFYLLLFAAPLAVIMPDRFLPAYTSEYDKLPKEARGMLDDFYTNIGALKGLTQNADKNDTLQASMATIEKYLYNKELNRTVGKPLSVTKEMNFSEIPEALRQIYAWHNGIEQFLPQGDLLSFEEAKHRYDDYINMMRDDEDENFTTEYRVFVLEYGYSGLAYSVNKEGIYAYDFYDTGETPPKRYYSFNHLLKLTVEAYKRGIYDVDYDGFEVDKAKFAALKREYLSKEDKVRYEKLLHYLQMRAEAWADVPYAYLKKELLRELAETHDGAMLPYIERYLHDKEKSVRQQAAHSLGVLGDRSAIPLLAAQLDEDPMHCRGCALSGLRYLVNKNDTALLKKIYPLLSEKKMWIRRNAYRVIGRIGSPSSLPILKANFDKEKPACKLAIVEALGRIGDPKALPLLRNYLKEIEKMDFSVSFADRMPSKNPHPQTLKMEVEKAIAVLSKRSDV